MHNFLLSHRRRDPAVTAAHRRNHRQSNRQQEAERSHTWCSQGPCGESLQMFSKHLGQISRSVALPIPESHSAAQLSSLKCCFPRKPQHLTSCHPRGPRGSLEIRSGSAQPRRRSPAPQARASAPASAAGRSRGDLAGQQIPPTHVSLGPLRELQPISQPHPGKCCWSPRRCRAETSSCPSPGLPVLGLPSPNSKLV